MIALLGLDFGSLEIGGLSDFLRNSEKLAAIDGIYIVWLTAADYFYSIDTLFNMLLVFQAEEVVFVGVDAADGECPLDSWWRRIRDLEEQVALLGPILGVQHEVSPCFGDGDFG